MKYRLSIPVFLHFPVFLSPVVGGRPASVQWHTGHGQPRGSRDPAELPGQSAISHHSLHQGQGHTTEGETYYHQVTSCH